MDTGSGADGVERVRELVRRSRVESLASWIAGLPLERAYTVIEALENALRLQEKRGSWYTYEAGLLPPHMVKLMNLGLVKVVFKTRRSTRAVFTDPGAVREAVQLAKKRLGLVKDTGEGGGGESLSGERVKELLLELVEGYEDLKEILIYSFDAEGVNIILVGPPASGKSLILELIGMLPGGKYVTVSRQSTTGKGLLQMILEYAGELRYLALDEFDKLPPREVEFFLHVAGEQRRIVVEKARATEDGVGLNESSVDLSSLNIYIGVNSLERLRKSKVAALLDRFLIFRMDEYDPERTKRIIFKYLVVMEGMDEKLALRVARGVVDELRINRVRVGIQVGRLCKNHGEKCVERVLATLRKRGVIV